jgi:hypothetical protein
MPKYKLKLLNDGGEALDEIECFATNPWLALEKSSKAIGRNVVEVRDGERTFGRFRTAFPMSQVWELSPTTRGRAKD